MALSSIVIDADALAETLSAQFGVALSGSLDRDRDGIVALIRATDIPPPNGFAIRITPGWRSLQAMFTPDTYAGNLIRTMGNASEAAKKHLGHVVAAFTALNNRYSIRINDTVVPSAGALPEPPWSRFELTALRMTDAMDVGGGSAAAEAAHVASACLASVLTLMPLEESAVSVALFEGGLPEGAKMRVEINRYERSPVNRAACIAIYGSRCFVCDLDFSEEYGSLGHGFIEVHHRIPVSRMGAGYVVDPARDLVPLCSNCHSMVHREDPPVDVEELKRLLARAR